MGSYLMIAETGHFREVEAPSGPAAQPGMCGLINEGNTCFLNATLQCLAHIPVFARFMT